MEQPKCCVCEAYATYLFDGDDRYKGDGKYYCGGHFPPYVDMRKPPKPYPGNILVEFTYHSTLYGDITKPNCQLLEAEPVPNRPGVFRIERGYLNLIPAGALVEAQPNEGGETYRITNRLSS